MDRYQYLILMGLCVLITLPLEVLFRARVWRRPRRLIGALAPALLLFVAWDLWATASGTWGFNDDYTIGLDLPGGMAVEELVFFTVIPICGLLTLETVRRILRVWDTTSGSTTERLAATARQPLAAGGRDGSGDAATRSTPPRGSSRSGPELDDGAAVAPDPTTGADPVPAPAVSVDRSRGGR